MTVAGATVRTTLEAFIRSAVAPASVTAPGTGHVVRELAPVAIPAGAIFHEITARAAAARGRTLLVLPDERRTA